CVVADVRVLHTASHCIPGLSPSGKAITGRWRCSRPRGDTTSDRQCPGETAERQRAYEGSAAGSRAVAGIRGSFDESLNLEEPTVFRLKPHRIATPATEPQPSQPSSRRRRTPSARPNLESLEGRQLLATFRWTGLGADANWTTAGNWVNVDINQVQAPNS